MNPPDDVTVTICPPGLLALRSIHRIDRSPSATGLEASPSSARRTGSGRGTARSASMRLRLRALRRPTSASMKARYSATVSKSREPREPQRVLDGALEMAVRPLDRAVLVRDAAIVAAGDHAVVAA
jgi:hypothetical protein